MVSKTKVQAVIFKRDYWGTERALRWLKARNFKPIKRVHKTENFLRYRLQNPKQFKRFRTKRFPRFDMDFIIGIK